MRVNVYCISVTLDDDLNNCVRTISNDNMAEGDQYHVMSDNHWYGHLPPRSQQPPGEKNVFRIISKSWKI